MSVDTTGYLQFAYDVPAGHCSSLRLHVYVDGNFALTTGFFGWYGAPAPFDALPLSSGFINLGPVASGTHTVAFVAEGQPGGCNGGTLSSWGGAATLRQARCAQPPEAVCGDVDLVATATCGAVGVVDAGSFDPDGDLVSCTQSPPGPYAPGTTTVTLTCTDALGNTDTCQGAVTVVDLTPPSLSCPAPTTAECTGNHAATVDPGDASATDNCTSDVSVTDYSAGSYGLGTTPVVYTATDEAALSSSCTTTVTVQDTTPPGISCPDHVVAECTGDGAATVDPGDASASDVCGGSSVTDPGAASYPLGTSTVDYTATDDAGLTAQCSSTVTVVDTTPPTVTSAGMALLWPPNHKYHTITAATCFASATDTCGISGDILASGVITAAYSDEPEDAPEAKGRGAENGDGSTLDDIILACGSGTAQVRAERLGNGDGRVYTLVFEFTDASGNATTATCTVGVPHDQGQGATPVDSGASTYSESCP